MQNGIKVGYNGMTQDFSKSKVPGEFYFEAKNIRIVATDESSSYSVTNEHGNELSFNIPTPFFDVANKRIYYTNTDGSTSSVYYVNDTGTIPGVEIERHFTDISSPGTNLMSGVQRIIGVEETRDGLIIFTTDSSGFDCVWEVKDININTALNVDLKYMRNMSFSRNNPIQAVYNYENSVIEKVYWVDGKNQLRFLNLRQSVSNGDVNNLIDMNVTSIDNVGNYNMSEPVIETVISGGTHTSGKIQYAYNLYRLNGAQTITSTFTDLIPLDKGNSLGGGDLNEVVSATPVVKISNIDTNYTHIKLYSIKYTSFGQAPAISLLFDKEIDNYSEIKHYDSGAIINTLSLAEFLFLGSNPFSPKHIASKDSRLFSFNIKELIFDVSIDTRAYSHDSGGVVKVFEDVTLGAGNIPTGTETTINTTTYVLPERHDAINRDYSTYKFQSNGVTYGAEGKYIKLEIDRTTLSQQESVKNKFFKDREIYRIGVEFYNRKGQKSLPKWICDIQAPEGNLEGFHNKLRFELKPEFYAWLNTASNFASEDDKPTGYKVLRSERTRSDRTILTQGLINPTVANYRHSSKVADKASIGSLVDTSLGLKMPSMVRMFESTTPIIKCINYHELAFMNESDDSFAALARDDRTEGFKAKASNEWRAQTYQYSRLMQIFSPDTIFDTVDVDSSNLLNIVGVQKYSITNNWSAEYNPVTKSNEANTKFINGITSNTPGAVANVISGYAYDMCNKGFFGPTNKPGTTQLNQTYREFKGGFVKNNGTKVYDIFGTPEITEIGADFKPYNNDSKLRYCNHLQSMVQDDWSSNTEVQDDAGIQIIGTNSFGARCITIAEGNDDTNTPMTSRKTIEEIFNATAITSKKSVMVSEIIRPDYIKYTGGIYGGNSYESKRRATYIGIGNYSSISTNSLLIKSPGDTFVQDFKFEKIFKTDIDFNGRQLTQLTEIVNIPLETTMDLKNRNDLSLTDWDNKYHPKGVDYHIYNKVYSQEPTLVKSSDIGFKFKSIKEFDTKVIASKSKIPGEYIDNWTDQLENETILLDGKYGPINAVVNLKDEIYTIQNNGVAYLSINPRVQTSGSDGISLQLGTGKVLDQYKYISTKSGTKNKWSVITTPNSFYYYDLLNKGIFGVSGGNVAGISDSNGFHSFFNNNSNLDEIIKDNPVNFNGISSGYNSINNEMFMTFHQAGNSFTICYNERTNSFTSFYDYKPVWYIDKGQRFLTTNPLNNQLWEHFKGKRNHFYGTHYPSSITHLIHPNIDRDVIFTGSEYKMEMNSPLNVDLPNVTFNEIRVWNEYQDTGDVTLALRSNINRKFRSWKVQFPRVKYGVNKSRDRVRNPWSYIKYTLNNNDGNKMTLHDLNIYYTEY